MDEKYTVIGKTIVIKGELEGNENLIIEGRIEGTINLKKNLTVKETGILEANVQTQNAEISGRISGNINVNDKIEITSSGRMIGDIKSPRLIIQDGAKFKGNIDMGEMNMGDMKIPLKDEKVEKIELESKPKEIEPESKPEEIKPENKPEEKKPEKTFGKKKNKKFGPGIKGPGKK
jgi:cytoskeletal protein CcmA (bactofilin family)